METLIVVNFMEKDLLSNMIKTAGKKNDVAFMISVRYFHFQEMLDLSRHHEFL